jgi:hypothetical protein
MKIAIIYAILILSLNLFQVNSSENKIINKFTKTMKDLISGIFSEVKCKSWTLPDTCLNEQFENDINGFLNHLKKRQFNYCSAYLTKITFVDVFDNCPADDIIYLYRDIKKSIQTGQIYINSLMNLKKIISLLIEAIKVRKLDPYDIGVFFGKLINLSVYTKNQTFFNLSYRYIENEKDEHHSKIFFSTIIKNTIKLLSVKLPTENKELIEQLTSNSNQYLNDNTTQDMMIEPRENFTNNENYRWGMILEKLLEKYERNNENTMLKKFFIYSLTSLKLVQEYIKEVDIENIQLPINKQKVYSLLDLISNMLENNF